MKSYGIISNFAKLHHLVSHVISVHINVLKFYVDLEIKWKYHIFSKYDKSYNPDE